MVVRVCPKLCSTVYSPEVMQITVFEGLGLVKKVTSWCLDAASWVWTEAGRSE